jgi:glycosyltransferase involved in cell wall biosynthesis
MKKRILVLADYYLPGYRAGGPVRSLSNLVNALPEDFDWHILTRDRDLLDTEPYTSVQIGHWVKIGPAQVYYACKAKLKLLAICYQLRQVRPDLLYLNSFFSPRFSLWPTLAAWFCLLPNTAILIAPRGEFSPGALAIKRSRKRLVLVLSRLLGLHARVNWHASTEEEANDIRRALGHGTGKIHVAINLGASTASLFPAPTDSKKIPRPKRLTPFRVCFLSRISRKKNLDYALKVLVNVRSPVHLTIYGPQEDPVYWSECRALMLSLPSHVSVEVGGPIPHEQVHERLSGQDLLFLPTRGENFGHVLAEALSAGLTLLTSDQTPWRNLTKRGLGYDLPLSDPEAFADAIDMLADEDVEQRAARRQRCIAYARLSLQDTNGIQAHREMFAAVTESGPNRP